MQKPFLQKETAPDEGLKTKIMGLLEDCSMNGDDGVPYPLNEDDTSHYLLWSSDSDAAGSDMCLIGALAVLPLSDESAECIAYVRPNKRRMGFFSSVMLPAALEDFSDLEFVFPLRNENKTVLAVLTSIGAQLESTEYLMEFRDEASSTDDSSLSGPSEKCCLSEDLSEQVLGYIPDTYSYPSDGEDSKGSCRLERISSDSVCLYDVRVRPGMQGQGIGEAMMLSLLKFLKSKGIGHVLLHVGADNLPAVSLYKKTGFRITETLSYYLF